MMRLLGILMFCIVFQGTIVAKEDVRTPEKFNSARCCPGPTGPQGQPGPAGTPGPNFDQYACLYRSSTQTLASGDKVLFENQISLEGITYDNTTGILTLQPGTYSVSYFTSPVGNLNLVANGGTVPNSPLVGSATILTLSNGTNTLWLQAFANTTLPAGTANQCNAMITIYQIN